MFKTQADIPENLTQPLKAKDNRTIEHEDSSVPCLIISYYNNNKSSTFRVISWSNEVGKLF